MKYKATDLSSVIFYSALSLEKVMQGNSLEHIEKWLEPDMLVKKFNIIAYVKQAIRDYGITSYILKKYVSDKKIHVKVECILRISLSLIIENNIKIHTLINQAVTSCKMHKHSYYANGLLNVVLRKAKNNIEEYKNLNLSFLPQWWQQQLQDENIIDVDSYYANIKNQPPLGLRVNPQKINVDEYLKLLNNLNIDAKKINLCDKYTPHALSLKNQIDVNILPNFADGYVSVQDIAAQICPQIIPFKDGMKVLDACSAPGGKILSCLEQYKLDVTVMDINNLRLEKIKQNIARLKLENQIIKYTEYVGDASNLDWWDNNKFDVVIADIPCSASGIVRKQPEIALLRKKEDMANLQQLQAKIIHNLWHVVKKSGILIYINCSIFMQEGLGQIKKFLSNNKDACLLNIDNIGQFEVCSTNDGFFYAVLQKNS
ncbi:MAG: hypothetical protein RLZZ210_267 [Pseudomonadota bacterium]|jgi:16S rRNA (cytosine967-C5)-methyltransferase